MMATRNHAICRHLSEDVSRRPKMSAASIRRVAAEQSRIGRIPCNGEVRGGSRTTSGILPSTLCVECIPAAGGQRDAVGSLVIASRPPAARAQRIDHGGGRWCLERTAGTEGRRFDFVACENRNRAGCAIGAWRSARVIPSFSWPGPTPSRALLGGHGRPPLPPRDCGFRPSPPPHSKSGAPEPTSELPRMAPLSARPSHRLSAHLPGGLPGAATPRRTSGLSPTHSRAETGLEKERDGPPLGRRMH
jgi:hypothetical protein